MKFDSVAFNVSSCELFATLPHKYGDEKMELNLQDFNQCSDPFGYQKLFCLLTCPLKLSSCTHFLCYSFFLQFVYNSEDQQECGMFHYLVVQFFFSSASVIFQFFSRHNLVPCSQLLFLFPAEYVRLCAERNVFERVSTNTVCLTP